MAKYVIDTPFIEVLPPNLAQDATLGNSANAINPDLYAVNSAIPDLLLFSRLALANPDSFLAPLKRLSQGNIKELSENLLDLLAWQLHVDGYESATNYAEKRALVDSSLLLHRRKGTPWAVKHALKCLGYDCEIEEGVGLLYWDGKAFFDGEHNFSESDGWALFDVILDIGENKGISGELTSKLREAIYAWKNVRSWLRAMRWQCTVEDIFELADSFKIGVDLAFLDNYLWHYPQSPLYNGVYRFDGIIDFSGNGPENIYFDGTGDALSLRLSQNLEDVHTSYAGFNGAFQFDGAIRFDGLCELPCNDSLDIYIKGLSYSDYYYRKLKEGFNLTTLNKIADSVYAYADFSGGADFSGLADFSGAMDASCGDGLDLQIKKELWYSGNLYFDGTYTFSGVDFQNEIC